MGDLVDPTKARARTGSSSAGPSDELKAIHGFFNSSPSLPVFVSLDSLEECIQPGRAEQTVGYARKKYSGADTELLLVGVGSASQIVEGIADFGLKLHSAASLNLEQGKGVYCAFNLPEMSREWTHYMVAEVDRKTNTVFLRQANPDTEIRYFPRYTIGDNKAVVGFVNMGEVLDKPLRVSLDEALQAEGQPFVALLSERTVVDTLRKVHADQLNITPETGTPVISSAQKFVIPIGKLPSGGEELKYPGGDVRAGDPICDYKGEPIGERGVVFFNYKDMAFQAVPGDGTGVIILNEVTKQQAQALEAKISSLATTPSRMTLEQIKEVLGFARDELGLKDAYNSSVDFINSKMTPVSSDRKSGKSPYGHMKRDDRDICYAVFVPGQFAFDGPSLTPQIFESGGVIVKQGDSLRGVQPEIFDRTYTLSNGAPLGSTRDLARVEPQ